MQLRYISAKGIMKHHKAVSQGLNMTILLNAYENLVFE